MKEFTANEYLASPLSLEEIEQYRNAQKRWIKFEKGSSIAFLSLINMPLFYLAMTSSWTEIFIGVGLVTVLYTFFKIYQKGVLDEKFPCRIVIDGFPFVSPQEVKSLQEDHIEEGMSVPNEFLNRIKALKRPLLNFEKSFLERLNKN